MMKTDGYRDVQYSPMLGVLGSFIVLGVGIAIGAVYGPLVRVALWLLGTVILAWLLFRTKLTVRIDEDGITLGGARITWDRISRIEVLEGEQMRNALTTGAHPNDFMRVRSTGKGARIWLNDPTDPHRCWLFSVRDSARLVRVLAEMGRQCDAA